MQLAAAPVSVEPYIWTTLGLIFPQPLQRRRVHGLGGKADQPHRVEIRAFLICVEGPPPQRRRQENVRGVLGGCRPHQFTEVEMLHEDRAAAGVEERKPAIVAADESGAQRRQRTVAWRKSLIEAKVAACILNEAAMGMDDTLGHRRRSGR